MVVKLTLYILGLSGLVTFTDDGRLGMDVILVNAQFKQELRLPAHAARLHVDGRKGLDENLKGYAVTVQCSGGGRPVSSTNGLQIVREDDVVPWQGLQWTADLSNIMKDVELRPGWMKGGEGRVTAALRLSEGRLEGAPPVTNGYQAIVWYVGEKKQALTDQLRYTLECPGNTVEFHLHPFAGGEPRIIRVSPATGSNIVATISNMPPKPMAHTRVNESLTHFAAIYQLLQRPPKEPFIPTIAEDRRDPAKTWDDPSRCGPPVTWKDPLPRPDPIPEMKVVRQF
jgi:hypothetical protein